MPSDTAAWLSAGCGRQRIGKQHEAEMLYCLRFAVALLLNIALELAYGSALTSTMHRNKRSGGRQRVKEEKGTAPPFDDSIFLSWHWGLPRVPLEETTSRQRLGGAWASREGAWEGRGGKGVYK